MNNRSRRAFGGALTSFLQYGLLVVLQALLAPLVLKIAGQEVLGAYSVLMQIIGFGILLDLGFSVALNRYLARTYGLEDKKELFTEVFNIGRFFLLITNIAFSLILVVVAWQIDSILNASEEVLSDARTALILLMVWTLIKTPVALYGHSLVATQNMAAVNIVAFVGGGVRLLLSLVLVFEEYGLLGLVLANVISEALVFLVQMHIFNNKHSDYNFSWSVVDRELFKEILHFGMKYWGVNLSAVLFLGSDSIVVGYLFGAGVASIYYTSKIPAFLLMQFAFRISDSASPGMNELFAKNDFTVLRSAYIRVFRYSMFIALPLAIGVVGFNKEVITAWVGAHQYAGEIMSMALSVFIVTQVVNHVNAMIVVGAGDLSRWNTVSIAASVASVLCSFFLGQAYGPQWVMVGIVLMDIPHFIFLQLRSLNGLRLPVSQFLREAVIPPVLTCAPLGVLILVLHIGSEITSHMSLIFYMVLYGVLWATCVMTIGINSDERQYWMAMLRFSR